LDQLNSPVEPKSFTNVAPAIGSALIIDASAA
jgi:hypothetical protein